MKADEIDFIIYNILLSRIDQRKKIQDLITYEQLMKLIISAKYYTLNEPILFRIDAPILIVGDLHGNVDDLIRIFERCGYPPKEKYLFLGDYIDRGQYSIEVISLLLALKCKYPDHIYLLRGNHETSLVSHYNGFYNECEIKYNLKLFYQFMKLFDSFPIAAIINNLVFCVHGGISPLLKNIEIFEGLPKPGEIYYSSVFADLLWSDPKESEEKFTPNTRGCGYFFSEAAITEFLSNNNLQFMIRSHEEKMWGFEWEQNQKCLTIFSNSDYCGHKNVGMICKITKDLRMEKELFVPLENEEKEKRRVILPEWLLSKIDQFDAHNSLSIFNIFNCYESLIDPIIDDLSIPIEIE